MADTQDISDVNIANVAALNFFNLVLRLTVLGIIVFAAATYLPNTTLEMNTKIMITVAVVVTYSLVDVIRSLIVSTKTRICQIAC
jgi:hypothetical protein